MLSVSRSQFLVATFFVVAFVWTGLVLSKCIGGGESRQCHCSSEYASGSWSSSNGKDHNAVTQQFEPMEKTIRQAQHIISSYPDVHPHYLKSYRQQERGYWGKIADWIYLYTRNSRPRAVLDVGLAYGTLALTTHLLTNATICGIDFINYLSPKMKRDYGMRVEMVNIELEELPTFSLGSGKPVMFDIIILTEVLEHFNFYPTSALHKLRERLVPGGRLFMSTPNFNIVKYRPAEFHKLTDLPLPKCNTKYRDQHIFHYSPAEATHVMEEAGLKVVRIEETKAHLRMELTRDEFPWSARVPTGRLDCTTTN